MLRDRRESQRKPVLMKTELEFNGEVREAMATDLSAHGAFCQLDNAPPIGTPVVVSVRGEGGSQIRVRSAVARHETSNLRGVGLSWQEEASSLLRRYFEPPVANSDHGTAPQPAQAKTSLFGDLPGGSSWNSTLEADGDSAFGEDPFAQLNQAVDVADWSQLPVSGSTSAAPEDGSVTHGFKSGDSVRFRLEGKWMIGRVRAGESNILQITSHWSIPLEGHVVQLAGASVVSEKLRVNEATGIVERVESVGSYGRQGGVFHLRLIHS